MIPLPTDALPAAMIQTTVVLDASPLMVALVLLLVVGAAILVGNGWRGRRRGRAWSRGRGMALLGDRRLAVGAAGRGRGR